MSQEEQDPWLEPAPIEHCPENGTYTVSKIIHLGPKVEYVALNRVVIHNGICTSVWVSPEGGVSKLPEGRMSNADVSFWHQMIYSHTLHVTKDPSHG